jgi:hypothetical protein
VKKNKGMTILNYGVNSDNTSPNYKKYFKYDPRLYNQHGSIVKLDRPSISSYTDLSTLSDNSSLDGYGKSYNSYDDINSGQYVYYTNENKNYPFYDHIFNDKATYIRSVYKDPMDCVKPVFDRISDSKYNPILTKLGPIEDDCNAFMRDSQSHREDMMSLQMRHRNQQTYTSE